MRVGVSASSAVHVQDACVEGLLIVEGKGHCIQATSPILSTWFLEHKELIFYMISKCSKQTQWLWTKVLDLQRQSEAECGLLSGSGSPAASRLAPSPSPSAPGRSWRILAGLHHPCQNTSPKNTQRITWKERTVKQKGPRPATHKKSYQREVGVGCTELQVDELVDISFRLHVEVLLNHRLHFWNKEKHCNACDWNQLETKHKGKQRLELENRAEETRAPLTCLFSADKLS